MYANIEIETSYKYLSKVISGLKEPICILGGWAVFFTVNAGYKSQTGKVYLGSRDIDIGFKSISAFQQAALTLEKELKFEKVSFRYYKNIHAETGKELTEEDAKKEPIYNIFPMYVDLILPSINERVKSEIGFTPIDEPLLNKVFENKKYNLTKEFGKKILLPKPDVLLAMKIKSVLARDKSHKRVKDICDIAALCLFSGVPVDSIIKSSREFVSPQIHKTFSNTDFTEPIFECSKILGIEKNVINSIISRIQNK